MQNIEYFFGDNSDSGLEVIEAAQSGASGITGDFSGCILVRLHDDISLLVGDAPADEDRGLLFSCPDNFDWPSEAPSSRDMYMVHYATVEPDEFAYVFTFPGEEYALIVYYFI